MAEKAVKELRKMRRSELIEIIYALETREAQLEQEKEALEDKLRQREILIEQSGSIAEAALGLNQVFAAAQAAADDYLASIRAKYEPDQTTRETAQESGQLTQEANQEAETVPEGEAADMAPPAQKQSEDTPEIQESGGDAS